MASEDGQAVASLVCGILCWFVCPIILAVVAIGLGSGNPNSLAVAGRILGWLNIIFYVAGIFIWLFFAAGIGILRSFF